MPVRHARRFFTFVFILATAPMFAAPTSFVTSIIQGFEHNDGQTDPRVQYFARAGAYTAFVTPDGVVLNVRGHGVGITFQSSSTASLESDGELGGVANYFRSDRPITGVRSFRRVIARNAYSNIDVQYRFDGPNVVFDLIAHPGADLSSVRLNVSGADACVDGNGDLLLDAGDGIVLRQLRPVVYQDAKQRTEIASSYRLLDDGNIGINVGSFDASRDLVIDPALVYATYINGPSSTDNAYGIFVDDKRNVYVTGDTASTDFPTVGSPVEGTYQGGSADAFVMKYAPDGTRVFATFLGGTESDRGYVITADASSNVYVAGTTFPGYTAGATPPGPTFPFTSGAYHTYPYPNAGVLNGTDIFIAKLNPSGSALVYAAHVAGSFSQAPTAIALDENNDRFPAGPAVILAGDVTSPTNAAYKSFPTTPGVIKTNGSGVAPDAFSYTTTYDGFVLKLNSLGSGLVFSTLFGGQFDDHIEAMGVDSTGALWIGGRTQSVDLPVTPNAYRSAYLGTVRSTFSRDDDAFLAKINAAGTQVLYCSYLGTSGIDKLHGLSVDKDDSVYFVGETGGSGFPTTQNAYKTTGGGGFLGKLESSGAVDFITLTGGDSATAVSVNGGLAYVAGYSQFNPIDAVSADQAASGGSADAFLQRFNAVGTALEYSTYLGGSGTDKATALVTDAAANAYVVGTTTSSNFPTTANAAQPSSSGGAGFFAKYVFDTDGDGLLDTWETNGIDINGDGIIDLNLAQLGADPNHKDLFVEIDYMTTNNHTHRPGYTPSGTVLPVNPIQQIVTAFANSPVTNPDGHQGVTLHVLVDEALGEVTPMTFAPPFPVISDFQTIKNGSPANPCGAGHFGTANDRSSTNCANILKAKRLVYRYCVFGHDVLSIAADVGNSGIAEVGGNDFAVTMRVHEATGIDFEKQANRNAANYGTSFNTEWTDAVAGTFMHELGHTLGLQHGGGLGISDPANREINLKPNYLSVMNYSRQFNVAAPAMTNPALRLRTTRALDFSASALAALDESSLFEPSGIAGPTGQVTLFSQGTNGAIRAADAGGAIDWNGQNNIDSGSVSADINYFPTVQGSLPSPGQILEGHDDWSNLVYSFRGSKSFGDGSAVNDTPEELSDIDVSALSLGELPPSVSLTTPSDGQQFNSGATISVSATASDADGTIQQVDFLDGGTILGSVTTPPYNYTWSGAAVGTHTLRAVATDNLGGAAASAPRTIQVGCSASLSPSAANVTAESASGTITVTIATGCTWTAASDSTWVTLGTVAGTGGGTISYSVDANPDATARAATVTVAGTSFTLSQDAAPAFAAPSGVVATAVRRTDGSFYVNVKWTGVANADHYEIAHSSDGSNYQSDGVSSRSPFKDDHVLANNAYLFKVRAVKSDGTNSAYSSPDLATTVAFTDDPLQATVTKASYLHVTELRSAINLVRALASLTAASWAETITTNVPIRASHITEMRSALDAARTRLSLAPMNYTDPSLSSGAPIKAVHIGDIRNGVN